MSAYEEFDFEVAPARGMRDPFEAKRAWSNAKHKWTRGGTADFNGVKVPIMGTMMVLDDSEIDTSKLPEFPSDQEIETFIRAREEYVAEQVLLECGWNEFVNRCKVVNIEDFVAQHAPCEAEDHQCNMLCPKFGKCEGNVNE